MARPAENGSSRFWAEWIVHPCTQEPGIINLLMCEDGCSQRAQRTRGRAKLCSPLDHQLPATNQQLSKNLREAAAAEIRIE